MSWNDNLQNNCLELQFAKKMSGTTIPKNMARTTTDKKKVGQDNNLQTKLYRTTIYKKKVGQNESLQKKVSRTPICKKLDRTIICEKQVVKNNTLQNLQKK